MIRWRDHFFMALGAMLVTVWIPTVPWVVTLGWGAIAALFGISVDLAIIVARNLEKLLRRGK